MIGSPAYPFSDLSLEELERLMESARAERGRAIRTMFLSFFQGRPKQRSSRIEREAPAASLGTCRA